MKTLALGRIARGVAWRSVWLTSQEIVSAGPLQESPPVPIGFSQIRLRGTQADEARIAREAMRAAADDDEGSVRDRLAYGDEMFGWRSEDGAVACFCWVRYHGRTVGPLSFKDRPGRVFLYNAHTLPQFRGCGLYAALLAEIRATLTREQHNEFIGDVDRRNTNSRRGLTRAGFEVVGCIKFVTVFRRWNQVLSTRIVDRSMAPLV